jgi:ketosteroid isomerase-like protein
MTPEECMEQMAAAAGDPDRLCSFASDDALYWFSNETSHVGKERIRATLKHNADLVSDYTYAAGPRKWLVQTDTVAVCVYPFHWTGKVGGQQMEGRGRATRVLEKRNGSWLVVHEHLSKGAVN